MSGDDVAGTSMCHATGSRYRTPTSWVVRTRRSSSSTILQAMDNNERASQYIDNLVECLQSVENPGDFACGGSIPLPLPALRVHGVDELVGLPICTSQAKAIIEQCSQAPYGRGEETIVDTAVRNTWQLNPFKFTILNPEWEQRLHDLVSRRGTGMRLHCERYLPTVQAFALRGRRVLQGIYVRSTAVCSRMCTLCRKLCSNAMNDCVPISEAKIGVSIVLYTYNPHTCGTYPSLVVLNHHILL